jgi:hypothetical protein
MASLPADLRGCPAAGVDLSGMRPLPCAIDAARCGRAVVVAADGRSATASRDGDTRDGTTRVVPALVAAVTAGVMELDFTIDSGAAAAFGIERGDVVAAAPRGGFKSEQTCTQWSLDPECYVWGKRELRAPFRRLPGGGGELVTLRCA